MISSSVADTAPVFDKILDSCERLFDTTGVGIYLVDDEAMLRSGGFVSLRGIDGAVSRHSWRPAASGRRFGRRASDPRAPTDSLPERAGRCRRACVNAASGRRNERLLGRHAPMLWRGRVVGVLMVSRDPPLAFTDKELRCSRRLEGRERLATRSRSARGIGGDAIRERRIVHLRDVARTTPTCPTQLRTIAEPHRLRHSMA